MLHLTTVDILAASQNATNGETERYIKVPTRFTVIVKRGCAGWRFSTVFLAVFESSWTERSEAGGTGVRNEVYWFGAVVYSSRLLRDFSTSGWIFVI